MPSLLPKQGRFFDCGIPNFWYGFQNHRLSLAMYAAHSHGRLHQYPSQWIARRQATTPACLPNTGPVFPHSCEGDSSLPDSRVSQYEIHRKMDAAARYKTWPECKQSPQVIEFSSRQSPQDISTPFYQQTFPLVTMAFNFAAILAFVSLAAVTNAAPSKTTCSNGVVVPDAMCCDFVPVSHPPPVFFMQHTESSYEIACICPTERGAHGRLW